ncbi:hypothetical protein DFH08DRAFT_902401 [Mycena albidolilacea]|uniref:Uncharacterized protein n=1 Tax=Mycena albidolilacea TaxID=1033008 RepID=A0AAD7E9V1_9AGAR|nr:hypothetical protein DFH08DRAFT_902401 [Mycena albidolilacea]
MHKISSVLVRSRKRIRSFVKGSYGRLKRGANAGANCQDLLWTSLTALRTCADACLPLKGAVGALVAIFEISERIAHSKKDARELGRHAVDVLKMLADATSNRDASSERMLASIVQFEKTLMEIQTEMDSLKARSTFWRLKHLNRNEGKFRSFNRRLDDASRAFMIGATARAEAGIYQVHTQILQTSAGFLAVRNKVMLLLRGIILMQTVFFCPSPVWRFRGAQLEFCAPLYLH